MLTWQIIEEALSSVVSEFSELGRISALTAGLEPEVVSQAGELIASRKRSFRIFDVGGMAAGPGFYAVPIEGAFVRIPYDLCIVVVQSRDDAQLFCQKLRPRGTLVTFSAFIHSDFTAVGPGIYRKH